jgi:hypothetical protein
MDGHLTGYFFPLGLAKQIYAKRWKVICHLMKIDFLRTFNYDENVGLDAIQTAQEE